MTQQYCKMPGHSSRRDTKKFARLKVYLLQDKDQTQNYLILSLPRIPQASPKRHEDVQLLVLVHPCTSRVSETFSLQISYLSLPPMICLLRCDPLHLFFVQLQRCSLSSVQRSLPLPCRLLGFSSVKLLLSRYFSALQSHS